MSNTLKKTTAQRGRRVWRVRSKVKGTTERPRMRVNVSNKHISAQIIDDTTHKTLVSSNTIGKKSSDGSSMMQKATWVGEDIAKKAATKKIKKVVLDRGYKQYHGRVKALADAAREAGLEF